jgi:hypothetical protein
MQALQSMGALARSFNQVGGLSAPTGEAGLPAAMLAASFGAGRRPTLSVSVAARALDSSRIGSVGPAATPAGGGVGVPGASLTSYTRPTSSFGTREQRQAGGPGGPVC